MGSEQSGTHVTAALSLGAISLVAGAIVVVFAAGVISPSGREALTAGPSLQSGAAEKGPAENSAAETLGPAPRTGTGLTEALAIEVAHAVAPQTIGRAVVVATSGPLADVWPDAVALDWAQGLSPDMPIWYLYFVSKEEQRSSIVVLDYVDGTVYEVTNGR